MNILDLIKEKVTNLREDRHTIGLKAVIHHIETAEKYLIRAKKENEENLFNDVIYRTKHAFEGMLKEAYTVLAEKDATKKTPSEIELTSEPIPNSKLRPDMIISKGNEKIIFKLLIIY